MVRLPDTTFRKEHHLAVPDPQAGWCAPYPLPKGDSAALPLRFHFGEVQFFQLHSVAGDKSRTLGQPVLARGTCSGAANFRGVHCAATCDEGASRLLGPTAVRRARQNRADSWRATAAVEIAEPPQEAQGLICHPARVVRGKCRARLTAGTSRASPTSLRSWALKPIKSQKHHGGAAFPCCKRRLDRGAAASTQGCSLGLVR